MCQIVAGDTVKCCVYQSIHRPGSEVEYIVGVQAGDCLTRHRHRGDSRRVPDGPEQVQIHVHQPCGSKDGLEHRNEHHLHQSGQVAHQEISNKLGNFGMAPPQLHQLADGAGLAQPFYASAHLAPSSRQEIWTWALP